MRYVPFYLDIFNAAAHGAAARDAARRDMYRRPDALPLPDEPATESGRSLAWLTAHARRRPAARARRAAG